MYCPVFLGLVVLSLSTTRWPAALKDALTLRQKQQGHLRDFCCKYKLAHGLLRLAFAVQRQLD